MKIKTKNGFVIFDARVVMMSELFELNTGINAVHELRITIGTSGMISIFEMKNQDAVLEAIEQIETAKRESKEVKRSHSDENPFVTGVIETDKTYMDGFKDGTEYALSLVKTKAFLDGK